MKLKIISDGKLTKVVNKDTGEEVHNITDIELRQSTGEFLTAIIYIADVALDADNIEGELYEN